jgi:hypothetical protein
MIDDRHVLDSFAKKSMAGGRKVYLGTAVGTALGGPALGAVGAVIGALGDVYAGQGLKKLIEMAPDVSGLLFVEQQMKKAAEKLDKIPSMLEKLQKKTWNTGKGAGINVIHEILMRSEKDEYKKRAPRHETMEKLKSEMSKLAGNPALFQEKIASIAAPLSGGGAPQIGAATSGKVAQAFNYVFEAMPKAPRPNSPFAKDVVFKPSDQAIANFSQKLQVVEDPFSVLDELEKGTLTRHHMEALQAVYPKLYAEIQHRVQRVAMDGEAKPIPYQARIKLSLLMGAPMDTSMNNQAVQQFQMSYNLPDQSVEPKPGNTVELAKSYETDTQRLEA